MRTCHPLLGVVFLAFFASAGLAAVPKAITKLPAEIKAPGRYLLSKSFTFNSPTAPAAILISSDNVILDLGEWTITCDPQLGITKDVAGIRADSRKNITIRNGAVRGFARGIYLEGTEETGGHRVENLRIDESTFLGIQVKGGGSTIRKNHVTHVGGATFATANRYGIIALGSGTTLIDNDVYDVAPSVANANAYGIYLESGNGSVIQGNRVANPALALPGIGSVVGITTISSSTIVAGNQFTYWRTGFSPVGNASNPGTFRDNTAVKCEVGFIPGAYTDGGGNQ